MMDSDIIEKRKVSEFRKLRSKWAEIKEEHSYVLTFYEYSKAELNIIIAKEAQKLKINDVFKEDEKKTQKKQNSVFEEDSTKEIFRKAARMSHPDIADEKKINEFKELVVAKKENHLNKLLDIADQFNIKNCEISYDQIDLIQQEIDDSIKDIQKMMNSIYWTWHMASEKQKTIILKNIISNLKNEQKK